jgi:formylglycine-generating enzyme required for sulfatase activity
MVEAPVADTQPLVDVATTNSAAPAVAPVTSGRQPIAWIVAAAVTLVLLLALFFILRGGGQPNTSGMATAAPQNTPADAFTAVLAAAALTAVPTTAAPTTAPTAAGISTAATAPTALAALPAPAGLLAYTDDFGAGADNSGLLGPPIAPDLALAVDPAGVFSMRLSTPDQTRWVFLPRLAAGDFSLQIDLSDASPDRTGGAAQGLVFRARDSAHFYALLLDPRHGTYRLRKQDGTDRWTDLIATTPSALIQQQDGLNQLRLDAAGDRFTLYLNGGALASARDSSYTFGMLGTLVANADARASTMHFDNLQIWTNDPPPIASTLPATRQGQSGDMVLIPGGEFVLGSNASPAALPQIVAQPAFYIDAKEVTNLAYLDCADRYGCSLPTPLDSATRTAYVTAPQYLDHPVVNVSWQQARFFCEQHGKRLPSEAEWEKAAGWSAATHTKAIWPWGDRFDAGRLNSAEGGRGDTVAVATFRDDLNGTFDMAGNVAEWTQSLFRPYPYDQADGREDPAAGGERVVRGGSWAQGQGEVSTDGRQAVAPDSARNTIGFRCAATP